MDFLNKFLITKVFAEDGVGGPVSVTIPNPIGCDNFGCIEDNIITSLLTLSIPIVVIMILIGGFQIMTAGGDMEKLKTGKKTILYTIIGYAVILVAKGVSLILRSLLGG